MFLCQNALTISVSPKRCDPDPILWAALFKVLPGMGVTLLPGTCRWFSKISKSVLPTSLPRLEISRALEKHKHEAEEW